MREQAKDEKSTRSCPNVLVTVVSHTRQDAVVLVSMGIYGQCHIFSNPGKCACYQMYP